MGAQGNVFAMFRIDAQGNQANRFVGGNPFGQVAGTVVSADFLNAVQEELAGFVESEGLALSKLNSAQLAAAIALAVRRLAGGTLSFTAAANLNAGDGLLVQDSFGVVVATVTTGQPAQLYLLGTYVLPKVSADSWSPGQKLYWSSSLAKLTTTSSGNRVAGVAAAAAIVSSTTASVTLSGAPAA